MSSNNYPGSETFVSVNPKDSLPYSRNSGSASQTSSHTRQHNYGHSSAQPLPSPAALFGGSASSAFSPQQPSGYPSYSPYVSQPYPSSRSAYQQYHQYPPSGLQPLSIGRPNEFSRSQYPSPDSPNGTQTVCVLPPPNVFPPLSELPPNDHQTRGEMPGFLPSLGKSAFMALSPINNLSMTEGNSSESGPGNQSQSQNSHHLLYSQYEYKNSNSNTTIKREREREREREMQAPVTDHEKIHSRKKSRGSFSSQMPLYATKVITSPSTPFSSPPETPPASGHHSADIHRPHKTSSVSMTFAGLNSPPTTPQVELSPRIRSHSPVSESNLNLRDGPYRCDDCGRSYTILIDLHEHKWEHSQSWKEVEKMVDLSKQQQVQIMEAAQILVEMASMSVKV